jgi:hypothetical protein
MSFYNWRELISRELKKQNETWSDVVSLTLTDKELNVSFDAGYGGENGKPFTLWTHNRVYFPTSYDGAENVQSVSRNPNGLPTEHI